MRWFPNVCFLNVYGILVIKHVLVLELLIIPLVQWSSNKMMMRSDREDESPPAFSPSYISYIPSCPVCISNESMAGSSSSTSMERQQVTTRVRLAKARDVPHIHRMIHEMVEFQNLTHLFSATEELLTTTLFPPNHKPFHTVTVLILEVLTSSSPTTSLQPQQKQQHDEEEEEDFVPIIRRIDLESPTVEDGEGEDTAGFFASSEGGGWVVAGYVLFFPNYSTFVGKPGFYVEDLFVRKAYRRRGFGRMLLSAVSSRAATMGMERVEWCVLDWNIDAIHFYQQMGADVLQEWRICRLTGPAVQAYANDKADDH